MVGILIRGAKSIVRQFCLMDKVSIMSGRHVETQLVNMCKGQLDSCRTASRGAEEDLYSSMVNGLHLGMVCGHDLVFNRLSFILINGKST